MKEETFFDNNYDVYDQNLGEYDDLFVNFLQNNIISDLPTLLDVGDGSGGFSKLALETIPRMECTVLDHSITLFNRFNNDHINKIYGKLSYDAEIKEKYDFINIKNVLHHITSQSVKESKMFKDTLKILYNALNEDGFLLIHEIFYEGYLIHELPSHLIFYLLKLQNSLKVKLPSKHFLFGLNVFFYTSATETSIIDMANMVNEFTSNTEEMFFVPRRDWDVKTRLISSIEKAKDILDYKPRFTFKKGLESSLQWFSDNWENIEISSEL